MEIAFQNREIRKICENEDEANFMFGASVANILQTRLADLDAAIIIKDVVAGFPSEINEKSGLLQIELVDGYKLIISANHVKNPVIEGNKVDWAKVKRVKIIQIEKENE